MLSILEHDTGAPTAPENPRKLTGLVHPRAAKEQLITEMSLYTSLLSRKTIYCNLGSAVINKAMCPFYNHGVQLLEPTQDALKGGRLGEINEKSDFLPLFSYLCCYIFWGRWRRHKPLLVIQCGHSQPSTAALLSRPPTAYNSSLHSDSRFMH